MRKFIRENVIVIFNCFAYYHHYIFITNIRSIFSNVILYTCRLGIIVDFLSHSTITGFMGGTATIICLQQLKGMFGLKHFTTKNDVVSVLHAIFSHKHEVFARSFLFTFFFSFFCLSLSRIFTITFGIP